MSKMSELLESHYERGYTKRCVGVFGLGHLGAPIAAAIAASSLFDVVGFDVDAEKVQAVNAGWAIVKEASLTQYVQMAGPSLVAAPATVEEVSRHAPSIFLIVVPTPSDESGRFSSKHVRDACFCITQSIAEHAAGGDVAALPLIVVISTLMPGSMTSLIETIQVRMGLRCGQDYLMVYSPTFLALGQVITGFLAPDFILIGESDPLSGLALLHFYRLVLTNDPAVARMSFENAELTKLALNCYVTMKISYANFLAELCEKMPGGDVDTITGALGHDRRISPHFFKGATPFGGPCFPRDLMALRAYAAGFGAPTVLAKAVSDINKLALLRLFDMVVDAVPPGGRVAVLGVAYKMGTPYLDEAVGADLACMFRAAGYDVVVYDPYLEGKMTAQECVDFADVVVITLPYEEFKELSFRPSQVIVDCWRIMGEMPPGVRLIQVGVNAV